MAIDLSQFIPFLERKWHTKFGPVGAIAFVVPGVNGVLKLAEAPAYMHALGALTAASGVWLAWWRAQKPRKTKKNKIGFVISISCDGDTEAKRVKDDFVIPLRKYLRESSSGEIFDIIELPQHLAQHVVDTGDATKLKIETKAHFVLFGRVRERVFSGKEQHFIDLGGGVSHSPIPMTIQKRFQREFSELLPRRLLLEKENDVLSFQFTSEWASVIVQYILGIASAVSGDLAQAESFYNDALKGLQGKSRKFPVYAKLTERIPVRIAELYMTRAGASYREWCQTRDTRLVDDVGRNLAHVAGKLGTSIGFLQLSAIHTFLAERDPQKSLAFLKQGKGVDRGDVEPDLVAARNCNVAFLFAYNGDLKAATRHYNRAAAAGIKADTMNQIEDFMCHILQVEPEKYQLHFCLGVFNWKIKGDEIQAAEDFNKFLESGDDNRFQKERGLAARWRNQLSPTRQITQQ